MVTFRSKFCEEKEEGSDQTGWTNKSGSNSWNSQSNQTGSSWTSSSNVRNEKKSFTFLPSITKENEKKKSY